MLSGALLNLVPIFTRFLPLPDIDWVSLKSFFREGGTLIGGKSVGLSEHDIAPP